MRLHLTPGTLHLDMATAQNRKRLEQAIREIWHQGLALSPDARHYIDSTFSNPVPEELQAMLDAESGCERDSLLELLLFPDQSVQVELEALLASDDFQPQDEQTIGRALAAADPPVNFLLPDGRGRLTLRACPWAAERFLARLNISRKTDRALAETIRRRVPEPYRTLCRVRLRNARSVYGGGKASFLCAFFEKMKSDFNELLDGFDFLLAFLEETADDADLYGALLRKKRFHLRNLQKAKNFEIRLNGSNMETLLMQGVRMPYIDQAEARRSIGLIDGICRAVFGRCESDGGVDAVDLGEYNRENGLQAAFWFFS